MKKDMPTDICEEFINIEGRLIGFDELVNSHTASKIVGLSARTLRDKASRKEIPAYRVSRSITCFLVRDLIEWSEAKRVAPA